MPLTYRQYQRRVEDCKRTRDRFWRIYSDPNTSDAERAIIRITMESPESTEINNSLQTHGDAFHNSTYRRRMARNRPRRDTDWVAVRPTVQDLLQALQRQKELMERALREAGY